MKTMKNKMASIEITICFFALVFLVEGAVVKIQSNVQASELSKRKKECHASTKNDTLYLQVDFCPRVWDGIMCWPITEAGNLSIQRCPSYINHFNTNHTATRKCTENGTWYIPPFRNRPWTNYTMCSIAKKMIFVEHMRNLRLVYGIGYGLSLVSLLLAVIIMLYFKRLHCQRNSIHINLFISFILRAAISFMKETMLVQGVGFESDIRRTTEGIVFIEEGTHWECKLFFTVFHYILGSNYMWIFVEAFYLHSLISIAVFSESSGTKWYILFGWSSALTFVLTWVAVRATKEDTLCWNTNTTPGYFWIMRGPILASTVLNFIFFINVLRVLFTKLNAANSPEAQKFRKLAKSTLVLIPLFGIHYIIFGGIPDRLDEKTELVKLYFDMFFSSLQGFFVALLFCFLNSEISLKMNLPFIVMEDLLNIKKGAHLEQLRKKTNLFQSIKRIQDREIERALYKRTYTYKRVQHEILKTWQRSRLSEINWSSCFCCLAPRMKRKWGRSRSYDGVARPSDISTVVSLSAINTQDCRVGETDTNYGDKAPRYFEQQPMINNVETQ